MKKITAIILCVLTAFCVWFGTSYFLDGVVKTWFKEDKPAEELPGEETPGDETPGVDTESPADSYWLPTMNLSCSSQVDMLNAFVTIPKNATTQPKAIKFISGSLGVVVGDNTNGEILDQFKRYAVIAPSEIELNEDNFVDGVITLNVPAKISYKGSEVDTTVKFKLNYTSSEDKGTILQFVDVTFDYVTSTDEKYYFDSLSSTYGFWDGVFAFTLQY